MSVMINKPMNTDGKTLLVGCLRTTVGKSREPKSFYFYLEDVKCGANAKSIHDTLLNCLQKPGFSME
jgi:hypothetical protein